MKKRYSIQKEQCECGLMEFYENAAKKMGIKITDKTQYDCRKICITRRVQDCIWNYYAEKGYSEEKITSILIQFGPKANISDNVFDFEAEDSFIVEE